MANYLYYSSEPPPHGDHVGFEVEEPRFAALVAAVERSRAQVMALDLRAGQAPAPDGANEQSGGWAEVPMTEAQAAALARHGVHPERELRWVQASLLVEDALGTPRGRQVATWLRENGASPEKAAKIIGLAEQDLRSGSRSSDKNASRNTGRRRRQAWAQAARAAPPPTVAAAPASMQRRIAR